MTLSSGQKLPRRGRGDGSIRQRPDGRYEGRITVDGRRLSVYGPTKTEVRKKMRDASAAAERGEPTVDSRATVQTFLHEWLGAQQDRVRPTTFESYRHYVMQHLIPGLGRHRLVNLLPEHVDRFLAVKKKDGLSDRTVHHLRAILRNALHWGERRGRISRNVASLSDAPRVLSKPLRVLSIEEARTLILAAGQDPLGPLYALALDTGMRQGELLGLRWQDIDLEKRTLKVIQAAQRIGKETLFGTPKSLTSSRTVVFTAVAAEMLRKHKADQDATRLSAGAQWKDHGLVFAGGQGEPLVGTTTTQRFRRFCAQHGIPSIRFHDLRHSSASMLIAQGAGLKEVSERLGHSSIGITADTYGHVAEETRVRTAAFMESLLTDASAT